MKKYRTEHIRFFSADGFKLAGLLFSPQTQTKKVAIFLHGNGSSSVFESIEDAQAYASAFTSKDISFFPFNNRGSGYIRSLKKNVDGVETRFKGGTAYELIKDCLYDIDGAVGHLRTLGFDEFYLIGESTGANKICVYDYCKKNNPISKYVLVSGGDDSGIYFEMLGKETFEKALLKAKTEINKGNGEVLIPPEYGDFMLSWQSFHDTLNPDGSYNSFPYNDYFNKLKLSTKELFYQFKAIKKPLMVVYGEVDEYCYGRVPDIVAHLDSIQSSTDYKSIIIPGGDHGLTGKMDQAAEGISKWISK
jgi:pimeloyl-ACP methyl ester carboxylesterase